MNVGVVGFGCYIPRFRIDRGVIFSAFKAPGEKEMTGKNAVIGGDEDSLTMAMEAARNAVALSGVPAKDLNALYAASCSGPYDEQPMANYLALLFNLPTDATLADITHTPRAGVAAVQAGFDAIKSGRVKNALVATTDARHAIVGSDLEQSIGCGAAALVLGSENTIADIEDFYSYSTLFIDRWRGNNDLGVRSYDYRYSRNEGYAKHMAAGVAGILKKTGRKITDFEHVVFQQIDSRMAATVAKGLGISDKQTALTGKLVKNIGDCGSAHVFIGLTAVLEQAKPGERILVVAYGAGTVDAFVLKVNNAIESKRKNPMLRGRGPSFSQYMTSSEDIDYVQFLRNIGHLERLEKSLMHIGVPPTSPFVQRSYKEHFQLQALECLNPDCRFVNYPPSMRKICVRCGKTEFKPYQLARTGKIAAYSVNYYMPAPLPYPMPLMTIEMDDGRGRMSAAGTEWIPEDAGIGVPVELVVRILDKSRGVTVYAYKARKL